jgi:hypothetical protein
MRECKDSYYNEHVSPDFTSCIKSLLVLRPEVRRC